MTTSTISTRRRTWRLPLATAALASSIILVPSGGSVAATAVPAYDDASSRVDTMTGITARDKAFLRTVARDSWNLYRIGVGVDPVTALPLDNVTYAGGSSSPTAYGTYTSAANVGVYLWAIVSARDLGIITTAEAERRVRATLATVARMDRYEGFLHQWYDTRTAQFIKTPEDPVCTQEDLEGTNNCTFISQVDNGWYVSGLVVVRQALPRVASVANNLLSQVDFSIFYDDRPQTECNVNSTLPNSPPTGQMYGGVYVGHDPAAENMYHNGALYSDPRISAYLGMGLRQMPGDVWWRTWRTLPPPAPGCETTDPVFNWQGQWPPGGYWTKVKDPISKKTFNVWEGHYTYPNDGMRYLPAWNNGMFEALMASMIVPETSWGKQNFGAANKRTVLMQKKYAVGKLGYSVWGMSPSSTADDSGNYGIFGASGWTFPENQQLANCGESWCGTSEDVVTPHAAFLAIDSQPGNAMANIRTLKRDFPGVYGAAGFFDALNPTTGAVGHRYLVLDQSMIMAAINNAVNDRRIQRYYARDSVSWAAKAVLRAEKMSFWGSP